MRPIKGQDNSTYLRFLDWLGRLAPELTSSRGTPRELLLRRYDDLVNSDNPHQRGYHLQDLLRDTFDHFDISAEPSFTRNRGGEQIDGACRINGCDYIIECRWRAKIAGMREVDGLLGQISRSGEQAMGIFFSINGWSENVPQLLKEDRRKSIILMDGRDFRAVLDGKITMPILLDGKTQALRLRAEPFVSATELIQQGRT